MIKHASFSATIPYTIDKSVTDLSQSYYEQIYYMSVTDLYLKLPQSCCTCVMYR